MNKILDSLYFGAFSDADGATRETLAPCTAILTLCEAAPAHGLRGMHYPLPDEVFLPESAWQTGMFILAAWINSGETVLVHCRLGVSRAPALVAAYLALTGHFPDPTTAGKWLGMLRPIVRIHPATMAGVMAWWDIHSGGRDAPRS